jgi:mRNA interferase MazF
MDHGRRPALIVTRSRAVARLNRVVVAPVTTTIRGLDTEIRLGRREGLRDACVASFDNLRVVLRARLTERAGSLGPRRDEICRALAALADC